MIELLEKYNLKESKADCLKYAVEFGLSMADQTLQKNHSNKR